jgi:glycosyltransferase involved in cell wall biosynthesis
MEAYSYHPQVRYFREEKNEGVDRDYDKAVGYSRGKYCWLFTDDDLLKPNAIKDILLSLQTGCNLLILNSEIKDARLNKFLMVKALEGDDYQATLMTDDIFQKFAFHLTFIGYVVIKRELWQLRNRDSYFGTAFIHIGVIFQSPPIENIFFKSSPVLTIRYGNAMWTPRGFQIWMCNWPRLIWSFNGFSLRAKGVITPLKPYENIRMLIYQRAIGAFTTKEYFKFLLFKSSLLSNMAGLIIAITPGPLVNLTVYLYFKKFRKDSNLSIYDLKRSIFHRIWFSKLLL